MHKKVTSVLLASMATASMLLAAPLPAHAANSCDDTMNTKPVQWRPDLHRVRAWCTDLNGDRKAQGYLNLVGALDKKTAWFTALNVSRYSSYDSGPNRGTSHKVDWV